MNAYRICCAIVFVAEAIIAWQYFNRIFYASKTITISVVAFSTCYIILFLVSLINNIAANAVSFFVGNLILAVSLYSCAFRAALLHSAFITVAMVIGEIIPAMASSIFLNDYSAYTRNVTVLIAISVSSKLIYFLLTLIASRVFDKEKGKDRGPSSLVIVCLIPLVSILISFSFTYIGVAYNIDSLSGVLVTLSVIALLFINIMAISVYSKIQEINEERMALKVNALKEQANTEFYSMLQTQYENQRILIHDIKAHLSTIEELAKESDSLRVEKYVEQLQTSEALVTRVTFCPEPVLNAILMRYNEMCQEQKVKFMCDIRASISFLDDTSITSLFENLLSNAFEAASKVAEGYIELSISNPGGADTSTVVTVVNSCDKQPGRNMSGELETTKHDKASHGYGMKSIARVIRKYGGSMKAYFDETANEFHVVLCFDG